MATKHYENGITGTSEGGSTDLSTDIFVTGSVFWVDSVSGNDANAGTNRNEPLATLAQAQTNATANNGDIIIVESGHAESLGATLTLNKAGIRYFGLGSGSNKPSFTVTAAVDGISIEAACIELNGFRFPAGTTANNTARVNIAGGCTYITDCDFICGQYDIESITVEDAGDNSVINGCTFTVSADGPDSAIEIESASLLGFCVISCTFDGGSNNWDNGAIYSSVANTEYRYRGNTLLNKANIIHTAASKGNCIGTVAGDGSRVEV